MYLQGMRVSEEDAGVQWKNQTRLADTKQLREVEVEEEEINPFSNTKCAFILIAFK